MVGMNCLLQVRGWARSSGGRECSDTEMEMADMDCSPGGCMHCSG